MLAWAAALWEGLRPRCELQTCFHCKHGRSLTWCTVLLFCPQLRQGVSCSQLSLDRPWHLDRVSWFYEYSHVAFDDSSLLRLCVVVFFSRPFKSTLVISAVPSSNVGLCFVVVINLIWFSNQKTFVSCDIFVCIDLRVLLYHKRPKQRLSWCRQISKHQLYLPQKPCAPLVGCKISFSFIPLPFQDKHRLWRHRRSPWRLGNDDLLMFHTLFLFLQIWGLAEAKRAIKGIFCETFHSESRIFSPIWGALDTFVCGSSKLGCDNWHVAGYSQQNTTAFCGNERVNWYNNVQRPSSPIQMSCHFLSLVTFWIGANWKYSTGQFGPGWTPNLLHESMRLTGEYF